MSGFFDTGTGGTGSGNINPGDLQTIINARDAAVAAQAASATSQSLAEGSATAAAASAASIGSAVADATAKAAQADVSASLAQQWAVQTATPVDVLAGTYGAQYYSERSSDTADLAAQSATDAQTSANSANTTAATSQQWASAPVGQQVSPGLESALSYAAKAKSAAAAAISLPKKVLADADFVSGKYTLKASDIVSYIVCTNTSGAGEITLPPGVFTGPGPDGGAGVAALHVVRRGSQNVTFACPAASVIAPNRLIDQLFTYTTTTTVASYTPATAHRVTVPAGTARKLTIMWFSLHSQAAQNTLSLTASNTSGLAKAFNESTTATGYYAGAAPSGIMATQYTADLADSLTSTIVDISPTTTFPWCYAIWVLATGNTAAVAGAVGSSTQVTLGTTSSQALTPAEANDMLVFGMAFQGADASPIVLSGGGTPTQAQNSQTGPTRTAKDMTVLFGYEVRPNTTLETYVATSAKSAERAALGVILKPAVGGGGAQSVITGGGTPTLTAVGKHATVWLDSDGITYDVEV